TTGIEHIYAAFSAIRWRELEDALAKQQPTSTAPVYNVIEPNGLSSRGIAGTRANTKQMDALILERVYQGKTRTFPISSESWEADGGVLVIERWFKHISPDSRNE